MKKNWMHKLFLTVFLFTMVTPVPVQAKALTGQAGEVPQQNAVGLLDPVAQSASLDKASFGGQAPIAAGTPVPVMAVGENVQNAPAPVQLDAPISINSGVAAPAQVGVGWYDDPSGDITWTGTWSTLNSGNALGGTYRASTTLNSTASLEFTGTQVSLIYAKAPNRGSMEIRIDGNLVTTLSMAAPTEQWQQRWDCPIQADSGPHTILLTHSVAGQVVIDAFEVTNPDPNAPLGQGYYEDTDSHFQYSGDWTAWSGSGPSGGGNHYSEIVGDTVSVTFSGTHLTLYYTGYTNRGIADIFIDGQKIDSLNQYSASLEFQKRWQSQILDNNGPHTLTIEHATGAHISIDALEIEDIQLPDPVGPGTYENTDPHMVYVGDWTLYNAASASGGSGHYSSTIGNYALFRFTGTQVNLIYTANVNNGTTEIRIDGQLIYTLNQYAASPSYQREWASPLMADEGPHTITITHASGGIIDVDALIVSNPETPGVGTYEDTSPLISYTGNWNPYDSASASDGSSRYSDQLGSSA
ncbi:MAG: hypothetical protein K8R77_03665, partial [Anaerolineaceae bacterium]|nr:hypothetical protein [Anaerolineaceae bacterium]